MSLKRTSDALVALPEQKRSRSELIAISNRDKALLEAVSNTSSFSINYNVNSNKCGFQIIVFFFSLIGSAKNIKSICTNYDSGRS